jgi:hypothetical protein
MKKDDKKGILSLIAKETIGSGGVSGYISDKIKEQTRSIQKRIDPKNLARTLGGQGLVGDLAVGTTDLLMKTAGYGIKKLFGGGKDKNKKDPRFTTVANGPIRPLKMGDSTADILGKMYNFMLKSDEVYKLNDEIERAFRQEQLDEDERRHKELVKAIKNYMKESKKTKKEGEPEKEEDESSGFMKFLKHFIEAEILLKLAKWAGGLVKEVAKFAFKVGKAIVSFLADITGIKKLLEKLKLIPPKEPKSVPEKNQPKGGKAGKSTPGEVVEETDKKGKTRYRDKKTGRYAKNPSVPKATKMTKALKAAKGVLNIIGKIPGLNIIAGGIGLYNEVEDAIEEHEDGGITDAELKKKITEAVGAALGGVAGAELGAALGGVAGSVIPGIGTTIGALAGGVGGFLLGEKEGKKLAGQLFDYLSNADEKQISEKINNIEVAAPPQPTNAAMPQQQSKTQIPDQLNENELGLGPNESVVAVNNSVKSIGGSPPKVLSVNSARQRNSDLERYLVNTAVIV